MFHATMQPDPVKGTPDRTTAFSVAQEPVGRTPPGPGADSSSPLDYLLLGVKLDDGHGGFGSAAAAPRSASEGRYAVHSGESTCADPDDASSRLAGGHRRLLSASNSRSRPAASRLRDLAPPERVVREDSVVR